LRQVLRIGHKLIRHLGITDTRVHRGQPFDTPQGKESGSRSLRTDSACRSMARKAQRRAPGCGSRTRRNGIEQCALNRHEQEAKHWRSITEV